MSSAICFNWDQSKIFSTGNLLTKTKKKDPFTKQSWLVLTLRKKAFENIEGKEENGW